MSTLRAAPGNTTLQASDSGILCNVGVYGNLGNNGPAAWAQNAVGHGIQLGASRGLQKFAEKHGMTLQEVNLLLALNSKVGFKVAGHTFDSDTGKLGGFFNRLDRPRLGLIWDINDTLLNVQGLLDAVSLHVVSSGHTGHVEGHSLGAWRANNLHRAGLVTGVTLQSLPLFAYPSSGASGTCINLDVICGGALFNIIRPGIRGYASPSRWNVRENHMWWNYPAPGSGG